MKVLCAFIFSVFLLLGAAFGAEAIQGEFLPSSSIAKLKEGDLIEATLRFWPIENADLSQFKKLDKALLFNSFYLAEISSLAPSQNNADVVELKGIFIVKTAKVQPIFAFKYNDSLIELKIGDVKVQELKDESKDFYILDQSLDASRIWMIIAGIVALLIILGVVKRKSVKNFLSKLRPDEIKKSKKKYDALFRIADKREDFELIYKDKEKWLPLLAEKTPAHMEFLAILNQHQFKKEWGNEEFADVRSSFEIIRRSFEK
jgi:hypothetical protein